MTASARELLVDASARLAAAGVASPQVDAEYLLAHALQLPRARLVVVEAVPDDAAAAFAALVERRCRREPLQHLLGDAAFRYITLAVGPGVFVPRPETELLIDAVRPRLEQGRQVRVVDLCAGSGALALSVAFEVPAARVWAVERSPAALRYLRANAIAARRAPGSDIEVVAGDITDPGLLSELTGTADAVVSNPPYVPAHVEVDVEVRADPPEAVFAGTDGLDLIPAVLERAATLLRSSGVLAVEHDDSHGSAVPAMLAADHRWRDVRAHRDLAGRARYATAERR